MTADNLARRLRDLADGPVDARLADLLREIADGVSASDASAEHWKAVADAEATRCTKEYGEEIRRLRSENTRLRNALERSAFIAERDAGMRIRGTGYEEAEEANRE